jgi:rRNA maturation protein Nop10
VEIWHRVGYSHQDNVEEMLAAIGVTYGKTPGLHGAYLITFEISESDPKWPQVAELIRQKGGFNFVWTEFTEREVLDAQWLKLGAAYQVGYAQPHGALEWKEVTFDNGCPQCGVGVRQKAPFRIEAEPRLGKNVFASLYSDWPLFCTSEVLAVLEAEGIQGYETWPVLLHKTGEPSQRVQQLMIPTVAEPALVEEFAEAERFQKEICQVCGQVRYTPYTRGMMPLRRASLATGVDFQLTCEWFGSGHAAHRDILVSNDVATLVVERGWQGLVLWPVQLV